MRNGGAISERPESEGADDTIELSRETPGDGAATRFDLPSRTRTDLPGRAPAQTERTRSDHTPSERIRTEPTHTERTRTDLPRRAEEAADPTGDTVESAVGGTLDGGAPPHPRRRSPWWWLRVACYLLVLVIVATPLVTAAKVWYVARQDQRPRSDAIIVLGAAQFNGRPGAVLEWRLQHALKLYREHVAPKIVTVGGNRPGDNFTEAGSGAAWLNQHGVPMSHLLPVRTGSDTLQSMIAVGKEFKRHHLKSAVIVTDPWHALRSATMARDNGIDAATSPTRSGPTVGSRDTQAHYIVRETGGYLYYVLIGRHRGDS